MILTPRLIEIALTAYDNPKSKTLDNFIEDFSRLIYIKKIIAKYKKTNNINERLLVNHIIMWFNSFNIKSALVILLSEISDSDYDVIFPILSYLNYLPEEYLNDNIEWNMDIVNKLNNL